MEGLINFLFIKPDSSPSFESLDGLLVIVVALVAAAPLARQPTIDGIPHISTI